MKTHKIILSMLTSAFLAGSVLAQNLPQSAVAIDPVTGVANVRSGVPSGTPAVLISAAPTSVTVNGVTTVTWSTSGFTGALNCTRTSSPVLSGWSGSSTLASGSLSVTMPSTPQTVTLTLSCTAGNGTASSSRNVSVSGSGVDCSNRPPAVLGSPRVLVNRQFSSLYGTDFPGTFGPTVLDSVADGTVAAYAFLAPVDNVISGFLLSTASPEGGRGAAIAGFSECPGEISETPANCYGGTGKTRNEWTTTGRIGSCNLIPGRQYYYNFSTQGSCVSGPDPGTPGANCFFRLESKRYVN